MSACLVRRKVEAGGTEVCRSTRVSDSEVSLAIVLSLVAFYIYYSVLCIVFMKSQWLEAVSNMSRRLMYSGLTAGQTL